MSAVLLVELPPAVVGGFKLYPTIIPNTATASKTTISAATAKVFGKSLLI